MKRGTSTFHTEDSQARVSLQDLDRETRRLGASQPYAGSGPANHMLPARGVMRL